MKKSMSIKLFSLLTIFVLMLGMSLVFFMFFTSSRENMETLLKSHIQSNVLNLKHYLDTNLQEENINEIKSHLDSISSISDSIESIQILNEEKVTIYSSNRNFSTYRKQICIPIFDISNVNIFHNDCYKIKTKFYKGLTPYYYDVNVYLCKTYLDSLLHNHTIALLVEYLLSLFILLLITWLVISKMLKNPLEKLRQFAYYENKTLSPFFIKELESVRYSLSMTFRRLHEEKKELYNLSTRDQLSGLYNKSSLLEKIEWLISEKVRNKESFAVILLDLDNFKIVNDSLGHNVGDKVLKEISQLLLHSVRNNDMVSRIGGDEFVIVLPDIEPGTKIVEVLKRVKANILSPIVLQSLKYQIAASMGIAIFPKDGRDANTLLRNADIAMYKSKELGKNKYHFFTDSFNAEIQEKIAMQNLLVDALENHYFELFYQPKTQIKTLKVSSCEALIRLVHPSKGLIPPNEFISIAEDNNFIIPLGYWIIQESVRQLKAWENTEFKEIKISINLSVKQFQDPDLITKLKEFTKEIDRSKLDIELTESVFVHNFDHQYLIINQIKELGFSLSLDDFGTGYSSLSYLKNIPFDTLKIDKTFIDDLATPNGQEFVKMIVNIAKTLDLEVVAEGVETQEQKEYLDTIHCDIYQGYLCSKPLKVKEFESLLQSRNYL